MDFDLEIIDEEGDDCQDPLFNCIMNAMNSMKEATADKIYQKIQKEGEMNYSKPQVDRALASALKYGIFEVRNNRYRVRDDILDDEDTVYWKLHKEREQTPFRIQEDINDKQSAPKLDPEKDNQRFRRRIVKKKSQECPHCGKTKKPGSECNKYKATKRAASYKKNRKPLKKERKNRQTAKRKIELKRKRGSDLKAKERFGKKKKPAETRPETQELSDKAFYQADKLLDQLKNEKNMTREKPRQTKAPSEINYSQGSDFSFESLAEDNDESRPRGKNFQSQNKFECRDADFNTVKVNVSNISIKSESDSEKSDTTFDSDDHDQNKNRHAFFDNLPCTSKNTNNKIKNQCLTSCETYNSKYESSHCEETDHCEEKSDWLGCSDEPQGAIIQSNNVLTIEPMDSLAFKSPEQASYIS